MTIGIFYNAERVFISRFNIPKSLKKKVNPSSPKALMKFEKKIYN